MRLQVKTRQVVIKGVFSVVEELRCVWRRLRRKLDEVGWRFSLYLILLKCAPPSIFQFRKFFITAIRPGRQDSSSRPGSCVREATGDDVELLAELGYTNESLRQQFESGHRVWVLESEGRFLACDWLLPSDKLISDWLVLEKTNGDIWSEVIFVSKEHRGQGLGPALRGHVTQLCWRSGFKRMLGIVDTLNHNSVRAMGKIGYEAIGCLQFFRIFGITFVHDGTAWRCGMWRKGQPLRISMGRVAEAPQSNNWDLMQRAK